MCEHEFDYYPGIRMYLCKKCGLELEIGDFNKIADKQYPITIVE